jgi:hypothetical protein
LVSVFYYDRATSEELSGDGAVSTPLFAGLLCAFFAPRLGLLGMRGVARRATFDSEANALSVELGYRVLWRGFVAGFSAAEVSERHAEARASDPLWHLEAGPFGVCTGRCLIALRRYLGFVLVACFPTAPALFLMLDNVAKNAASGGALLHAGPSSWGGLSSSGAAASSRPGPHHRVQTPPPRTASTVTTSTVLQTAMRRAGMAESVASEGVATTLHSDEGGCCCCCCCGGSAVARGAEGNHQPVVITRTDDANALVFAAYLIASFGSQLALCWSVRWPIAAAAGLVAYDDSDDAHNQDLTVSR